MHHLKRPLFMATWLLALNIPALANESKGEIEFAVTGYGIYSTATNGADNEGKLFEYDDVGTTVPGWSGSGGGFALGLSAMWRGYLGLDVQVVRTFHTLEGAFNDARGYKFDFQSESGQYHVPIMLKAAWPTKWVTPTLSAGFAWFRSDVESDSVTIEGNGPDETSIHIQSQDRWATRFGLGLEKKLPFDGHDVRLSLNVMMTYDAEVAGALDGIEKTSICYEPGYDGAPAEICNLFTFAGTAWQTDLMFGVGYHF
ncbi:MAG: hypothetical protein VYD19_07125 [Myxococcota bacterium]|nr:hypothetical protein [Myxococcota bacterium]